MSASNLTLHCGASLVEKTDERLYRTPESLGPNHSPIPHLTLIDSVIEALDAHNMTVVDEAYATVKNGQRLFGIIEVAYGGSHAHADAANDTFARGDYTFARGDYSTMFGLIASHDMSLAARLLNGKRVWICDNTSYSGEVTLATKQTTHLMDRLPTMVNDAVSKVKTLVVADQRRVQAYQDTEITGSVADAAITQLVRIGAIMPTMAKRVIEQWDNPRFEQFAERSDVWRLHNAVTEVYKPTVGGKPTQMFNTAGRSIKLTQLCDELASV